MDIPGNSSDNHLALKNKVEERAEIRNRRWTEEGRNTSEADQGWQIVEVISKQVHLYSKYDFRIQTYLDLVVLGLFGI
jgi:hypothetical protein